MFCLKNFDTFTRTSVRVSKWMVFTFQMLTALQKYHTYVYEVWYMYFLLHKQVWKHHPLWKCACVVTNRSVCRSRQYQIPTIVGNYTHPCHANTLYLDVCSDRKVKATCERLCVLNCLRKYETSFWGNLKRVFCELDYLRSDVLSNTEYIYHGPLFVLFVPKHL